jgi:hypothetical protein
MAPVEVEIDEVATAAPQEPPLNPPRRFNRADSVLEALYIARSRLAASHRPVNIVVLALREVTTQAADCDVQRDFDVSGCRNRLRCVRLMQSSAPRRSFT